MRQSYIIRFVLVFIAFMGANFMFIPLGTINSVLQPEIADVTKSGCVNNNGCFPTPV